MKYKRFVFTILFLSVFLIGFITLTSSGSKQNVDQNSDVIIIKEFRSHQKYSASELEALEIKYLGSVDDYRIYYVSFKEQGKANEKPFVKGDYVFPVVSQTRILGIKDKKVYTLGNMLYETQINVKEIYNLIPNEFKKSK